MTAFERSSRLAAVGLWIWAASIPFGVGAGFLFGVIAGMAAGLAVLAAGVVTFTIGCGRMIDNGGWDPDWWS